MIARTGETVAARPALELLQLLQLADACFPSGGFAFSNGLESLAKLGYVKRLRDFRQYLDCHLEQVTSSEMPFLNSAHLHALGEEEAFETVVREWDAWLFMPAQRKGSLAQGQAWSRAMEETFGDPGILALRPWFQARDLPLHFLMIFSASLKAAGIRRADAQSLLLHLTLRDQLGAAVRLGLLGSLHAQKLHREFLQVGEMHRVLRADWEFGRASRSAPMIELAQASHPNLYSKLFQS
ncbi:MAG: urease accessory UreF family protein [Fibrobacteria bacterium]